MTEESWQVAVRWRWFLPCSWQVLGQLPWKARCKSWGQCWRSFWQVGLPRFLHGACFQVVPPNGAKIPRSAFASLKATRSLDISYVFVVNEVNNSSPVAK